MREWWSWEKDLWRKKDPGKRAAACSYILQDEHTLGLGRRLWDWGWDWGGSVTDAAQELVRLKNWDGSRAMIGWFLVPGEFPFPNMSEAILLGTYSANKILRNPMEFQMPGT